MIIEEYIAKAINVIKAKEPKTEQENLLLYLYEDSVLCRKTIEAQNNLIQEFTTTIKELKT